MRISAPPSPHPQGPLTSAAETAPALVTRPVRVRDGSNPEWTGEQPPRSTEDYWVGSRRPIQCFLFLAPFLLAYEWGVHVSAPHETVSRSGVDSAITGFLDAAGLDGWGTFLIPSSLLVAIASWQLIAKESLRPDPRFLPAMGLECVVFAFGLLGVSELIDSGLARLDTWDIGSTSTSIPVPETVQETSRWWLGCLGLLGAGIYEEAVFRALLIPALYWPARRVGLPGWIAGTMAVTGSALAFALAHHLGQYGEGFTWFAFLFRWAAGIYFAWIFVVRGFAIVVGTHIAYNVMVVGLEWAG